MSKHILFFMCHCQDPKDLPLAVVNLEGGGLPCSGADVPTECPVEIG